MAYSDFNEQKYILITDTSTVNKMGSVVFDSPIELEHMRLELYKHGTEAGTEQFRVNIYSDPDYSTVYAQSATVDIADIVGLSTYWIGWVRFDFAGLPVLGNNRNRFYIGLEPVTYTRNADTFYIGAGADWFPSVNTVGSGVGAYMEFYERAVSDVCG